MKTCFCLTLFLSSFVWAQAPTIANAGASPNPAAEIKPDTVIVTVNGRPVTAAEMDQVLASLAPTQKATAMRQPEQFLQQWAHMQTIVAIAEKDKLDQQSPYKERLAEIRRQVLANAALNEKSTQTLVTPEQQKKYYDEHKGSYTEAQTKVIYVPFSGAANPATNADGTKPLSEEEAKAKAEEAAKKARSGGDFGALVKEYSANPGSLSKEGNTSFTIRSTNNTLPVPIRDAVGKLKAGDISDPVRTDNGFYIFKVETASILPYDQVKDDIYKELKEQAVRKWLDDTRKQSTFKIENGAYFNRPSQ